MSLKARSAAGCYILLFLFSRLTQVVVVWVVCVKEWFPEQNDCGPCEKWLFWEWKGRVAPMVCWQMQWTLFAGNRWSPWFYFIYFPKAFPLESYNASERRSVWPRSGQICLAVPGQSVISAKGKMVKKECIVLTLWSHGLGTCWDCVEIIVSEKPVVLVFINA